MSKKMHIPIPSSSTPCATNEALD